MGRCGRRRGGGSYLHIVLRRLRVPSERGKPLMRPEREREGEALVTGVPGAAAQE